MRDRVLATARELLPLPTAPFRENAVREHISAFCEERAIRVSRDRMGNLVATYGGGYANPVLAFSAHMDHPGFIVEADSRRKRTTARFYGGVEEGYFKGTGVIAFTNSGTVHGKITRVVSLPDIRAKRVWLELDANVRRGDVAMWDVSPFRVRGDRLYSRWCDDGAGCVAVLALLDELHRRRLQQKVMAVFTTAEEAGFHGVKYVCTRRKVPKSATVIAIEASSELPTARIGDGVVIRVGDRKSIFTPGITAFMVDAASRLRAEDADFRYQRKLMDGGTCESTVYSTFGHTNGAVCVPLGNYHNRNTCKGKIAAEYVSVSDVTNMVKLFLEMVKTSNALRGFTRPGRPSYRATTGDLGEQMLW
jgi:putative aminopeptidase FrvX